MTLVTLTNPQESVVARTFGLPAEARLQPLLERLLVWSETSQFSNAGFEGVGLRNIAVVKGAMPDDVAAALAEIERLCGSSTPAAASKKLAELRVLTAHRARDGIDVELMAGAYTERLAAYPADIVVAAVEGWANREEFWPTWAELKAECDKRMRGRKMIRQALVEWRAQAAQARSAAQ